MGVVDDTEVRPNPESTREPQVYLPYVDPFRHSVQDYRLGTLIARTTHPAIEATLRSAVEGVGGEVLFAKSMSDAVQRIYAPAQARATLGAFYAALALMLATAGTYGLLRVVVIARLREIGIRLALGGTSRQIVSLLAWYAIRLTLLGTVIGSIAAVVVLNLARSRVLGFSGPTFDVYLLASAFLLLGSIAAIVGPAVTAARVQPKTILGQ